MSEENKKNSEWKEREVGALWKKEGSNQNYYSGRINLKKFSDKDQINIVGFANKNKDKTSAVSLGNCFVLLVAMAAQISLKNKFSVFLFCFGFVCFGLVCFVFGGGGARRIFPAQRDQTFHLSDCLLERT